MSVSADAGLLYSSRPLNLTSQPLICLDYRAGNRPLLWITVSLPGTTVSSTTLSLDSAVSPPPPESDLTTFLRLSITRNDPERFGDCKSSRICGKFILSAESGFITRTRAPISLTLTSPLTSLI